MTDNGRRPDVLWRPSCFNLAGIPNYLVEGESEFAVFRFYVENFPAIVVVDSAGNNLYETEPLKYKK